MRQLRFNRNNSMLDIEPEERMSIDEITYSHPRQPEVGEKLFHAINCTQLSMEFNEHITIPSDGAEYCIVEPGFNNIRKLTGNKQYVKFVMTTALATRLLILQRVMDEKLLNKDMFCSKYTAEILGINGKPVDILSKYMPHKFISYHEYCYDKNKTKVLDDYSASTIIDMMHNGASHAYMALDMIKNFNIKNSKKQLLMIVDRCKDINTPGIKATIDNLRDVVMMCSQLPPKVTKTKTGYYVMYDGIKILEVKKQHPAFVRVDNYIYMYYAKYFLGLSKDELIDEIEEGSIKGSYEKVGG